MRKAQNKLPSRTYVKAGLVASVAAVLLYGGVQYYIASMPEGTDDNLARIDVMRSKGVPAFTLPDLKGKEFSLASLKGEITVVSFWASWCAPCVHEFPSMVKLVSHYKGRVKLVTIAADQRKEDVLEFLNAFNFKEPNVSYLWDPSLQVGKSYGTQRLPETYIVDKDLRLIKKIASSQDWMDPMVLAYFDQLLTQDKH